VAKTKVEQTSRTSNLSARIGFWPVPATACVVVLVHLLTNARYGFYCDELQFMSDGRHLAWGFVAYPPVAPLLARISTTLFGVSLSGLRLFPSLAQAAALVVTALMAKELGGGRLAQAAAALAIGLSPYPLYEGMAFEYTPFDYLVWVLAAYFAIRLLRSGNPRWWLAIGMIEGLGLLTKYTIAFLIAGILCGVILTGARRYLASGWFWAGHALALIIFLPNVVWQFRHDFISYSFLQFIHSRDMEKGLTDNFLIEQLMYCVNLFALPLCVAGLIGYMRSQRYRMIGWMYLVPLVLFIITKARTYYLAPGYPMLVAMGSQMGERWIGMSSTKAAWPRTVRRGNRSAHPKGSMSWSGRQWTGVAFFAGVLLFGVTVCAIILPVQSKGPLHDLALQRNELLRDEFGWNELVRTVASLRDSLPPDRQTHMGILVDDYGEEGAIEILGSAYHLPPPISTINSGWLRGYPSPPPPTTLIVVGFSRDMASALFSACKLAGHNGNSEGVKNEESEKHPDIFLCGPPRLPWPEFWGNSPQFE
jgi:hypothetical protein